jgi:hypothetical protein
MNFNKNRSAFDDYDSSYDDPFTENTEYSEYTSDSFRAPEPYDPTGNEFYDPTPVASHHSKHTSINFDSIPRKYVGIVLGVVLVIAFCIIFRQQITDFLNMVLSWVITIVVIVAVVYILLRVLFGGRRRRW